jgi:transcriptional regulator with GAF, ATPase, and Fis domain
VVDSAAQAHDDVVRDHVREALRRTGGNQAAAARLLGIHPNTLRKHLVRMEFPDVGTQR